MDREGEQVSVFNEPYKAILEDTNLGVHIIITAVAEGDTEADKKEADRRAKVIMDHFKFIIKGA